MKQDLNFSSNIPNINQPSDPCRSDRAFAMLLVIVALAVVTVSTAAFLASKLNAPDASDNVGRAVRARVAAETGVEIATAILESDTLDWRTQHINGVLLDNYNFGLGTVTVTVADLEGNPPTADTTDIILTAEGTAEGLVQITEVEVNAPRSNPEIQLDLGEFALFGTESIRIDNSTIKPWLHSPNAELRRPLRIGTNATTSSAVRLGAGTRAGTAKYYALSGASDFLLADASGMLNPPTRSDITEANPIPLPTSPTPDTSYDEAYPIYHPSIANGEWPLTETTAVAGNLTVSDFANVLMATPNISLLVNGDLNLLNGGDIKISAPVNIVVNGNLNMTDYSAIELRDGGSVNLYINGDFDLSNGTIGLDETLTFPADHDPSAGIGYYQDPARFKIYQLPTSGSQNWTIDNKAYACATFYAPNVNLKVQTNSAVFGNVVADTILFESGSTLFYDSVLDSGWGYTNPASFIYTAMGDYDTNVTTAATDLEDSTLNDINTYVTEVSSKHESKKNWKKIRKRIRRHGLRHREASDDTVAAAPPAAAVAN